MSAVKFDLKNDDGSSQTYSACYCRLPVDGNLSLVFRQRHSWTVAGKIRTGLRAVGSITSSVQFGFIGGTLLFAFFTLADKFSPRIVFFVCSVSGALANLGIYFADTFDSLLVFRCLTGFSGRGVSGGNENRRRLA